MKVSPTKAVVVLLFGTLLSACAKDGPPVILSKKSPVELRAMQSRAFETDDQNKVFRTVIDTLLDLGYKIDKVEPSAGTVTGQKLAMLTMTATVYAKTENRTIVRSNAVVKYVASTSQGNQVDSPEFYQKCFFEPLAKALFLTALNVEDPPDQEAVEGDSEVKESRTETKPYSAP